MTVETLPANQPDAAPDHRWVHCVGVGIQPDVVVTVLKSAGGHDHRRATRPDGTGGDPGSLPNRSGWARSSVS
jgi:hypothetical protein